MMTMTDTEIRDYNITLTIRGTYYQGEKIPSNLATMLNNFLGAWRDGRRPLEVEILHDAFERILKLAARECLAKELEEKYGNEMVDSEGGQHQTAKWYLELYKREKEISKMLPFLHEDWKAKIERKVTEKEYQSLRNYINQSNEELAS